MMADVVVTDGHQRSALAVVRSLGRAGHRVRVCAPRVPSLAGTSRYALEDVRVASPLTDPPRFVRELAAFVAGSGADVLLPVTDEALAAVLPERARFPDARIPFPDFETYQRGSDKASLMEVARDVGIAVPGQWTAEEQDAAEGGDLGSLPYPVVVKPSRSVVDVAGKQVKLSVGYALDESGLRAALRELPAEAFPVLVQERIEGEGIGVFLLTWDGRTRAVFGHRRLREKPPSGGVSTFRESVRPDPALVERCESLMGALGWQGVAMVEFKQSAITGVPYLMEVNGRFWGSLQLAVDAGVDFPALLVRAALGEPLPPPPQLRPDVRLRWLWGEVDHLVARFRNGPGVNGSGSPTGSGRWAALRDVVGSWRPGERLETLRLTDPRPFLRETADWMRAL